MQGIKSALALRFAREFVEIGWEDEWEFVFSERERDEINFALGRQISIDEEEKFSALVRTKIAKIRE